MNINNLGLLNSLSNIINDGDKDSDYTIALFILNNLYRVNELTINIVADESFTSRSAIRRFCNRLGYRNFGDFKKSISKIIFPSNLRHRELKALEDHRKHLDFLITTMIDDIKICMTSAKIKEVAEKIHEYEKVILICANNTSGDIIRFQQELFYAGKTISVVCNSYTNNNVIKDLDEDSLLITISASGKFAQVANDWIEELPGRKILITANRDSIFNSVYDIIYHISKTGFSNDYLGIYGKYGITYVFDLISACYLYQYAKE